MQSETILDPQSSELIAVDDSELDMVSGGRWWKGGHGNGSRGGRGGGINIDLDVNVAVIAGNIVLSNGAVSFAINQS